MNDTEVDVALQKLVVKYRHIRWYVIGSILFIVAAALITLGVFVGNEASVQHNEILAACALYQDLAGRPVTPTTVQHRPTKLAVSIVADARRTAYSLNCPRIPPPDPSVVRWASYYKIKL